MARAACKIIINDIMEAMCGSLERILTSPLVRDEMLSSAKCDELLDELVTIELRMVNPPHLVTDNARTLNHIVADLVQEGVVTERIWEILSPPVLSTTNQNQD